MLRNYFLINIMLLALLGFLGVKLYKVATYSMEIPTEASVEGERKLPDIDAGLKIRTPGKASFKLIADKDLFRPTRTAPAATVRKTPANSRSGSPKLFATILRGSDSIAIIEDPGTKKSKPYRINDLVAGYLVSEIHEDRVVLLAGDEKIEVKLREDKGIKSKVPQTLIRQNLDQNKKRRAIPARRAPSRNPNQGKDLPGLSK